MSKFYFCIDVGGTDIKGGVIEENYNVLCEDKISSYEIRTNGTLDKSILNIIKILEEKSGLQINSSNGLGIGLPGLVDDKKIKYLGNLNLKEYDIIGKLQKTITVPIKISNDAELALLAEQKLGAGKGYNNFALLTLGTGVGLGLVINGKNLRSILPFSCEYGHNLFMQDTSGDLEGMVSTRSLVNQTRNAMQNNLNSKIWTKYNLENVSGKTVFEFKDTDETAKMVFDNYIKNLGVAIINLYNIFTPDVIVLGGGISKQGKNLTTPLENFVNENIFIKSIGKKVKIVTAKHHNNAGILGARCLFD